MNRDEILVYEPRSGDKTELQEGDVLTYEDFSGTRGPQLVYFTRSMSTNEERRLRIGNHRDDKLILNGPIDDFIRKIRRETGLRCEEDVRCRTSSPRPQRVFELQR